MDKSGEVDCQVRFSLAPGDDDVGFIVFPFTVGPNTGRFVEIYGKDFSRPIRQRQSYHDEGFPTLRD